MAADYPQITGVQALEPAVSDPLALPEDSPITAPRLLELLSVLDERGALTRTGSVDCSDPRILRLQYDGRFQVEMYYDADFPFKVSCLLSAVEKLEPNETGILRMTFSDDYEVHLIRFPE